MKIDKNFSYFLGFLWADGYLWSNPKTNTFRVILENSSDDLDILLPFFNGIGHFSLFRRWRKNSTKEILRATLNNKKLFNFLMDNGFSNKLSPHTVLQKIPKKFHCYFWRGLFDGDGYFGVIERKTRNSTDYVIEITSDYNQDWSELSNLCQKSNINFKIEQVIYKESRRSVFSIRTIESMIKFGNILYKGYTKKEVGLPRKHNKFLQILNH